jgi:ankyrin repeat protein
MLLSSGADIEVRGKDGNRPLHTVALFGHTDLTALLVTRGADINARNDWGWTPLHFAASQDQADIVDVLLKYGADVQARNKSGRTPLGEVSRNTRIESALKKRGAER